MKKDASAAAAQRTEEKRPAKGKRQLNPGGSDSSGLFSGFLP
jgi:hypothetical protein